MVKTKERIWIGLLVTLSILLLTALILLCTFALYVDRFRDEGPNMEMFSEKAADKTTHFYYMDGEEAVELVDQQIGSAYSGEYLSYDELPEDLIDAFVAIEDKRFWTHDGMDWKRTVGAVANYFLRFRGNFGGSTITQQLIKNITGASEVSISRKIREIMWALELEEQLDKYEILELYVNVINLSDGCAGVRAAAEHYFSKSPGELTLAECACLAAIANNPSYYNPIRYPENNKTRRALILSAMQENGYITEEECRAAREEELVLQIKETTYNEINSWYVDMVIEDVIDDLVEQKGYTREEAAGLIYGGGLHIYTAMDPRVQSILDRYYADEANFGSNGAQCAAIVLDPHTGDVAGVAGAVGEKTGNRVQNYATLTVRPSGSTIKPLSVYSPALEAGLITWSSVYDDTPAEFVRDASGSLAPWPKNANYVYRGLTTISYAVKVSLNTVAVKVLEEVGEERAFAYLSEKLGMESLIERRVLPDGSVITDKDTAALALGQMNYGVSVREITAAYTMLADEGVYHKPRSYYRVCDKYGRELLNNELEESRVIGSDTACVMTKMLQGVVSGGTAGRIKLASHIDTAGKTGTTQNNCDKWFIGYTPYYLCGVWYGYEYPKPIESAVKNRYLEIWNEVMSEIHEPYIGEEDREFPMDENVVRARYCMDSGKLLGEACGYDPRGNRAEWGYFVKGTEPRTYCDCHVTVDYDNACGAVAGPDCPRENIGRVALLRVQRSFPIQVTVSDAQYVYRDLPTDVLPGEDDSKPYFYHTLASGRYCGISNADKQYNCYCHEHFNYTAWVFRRHGVSTE